MSDEYSFDVILYSPMWGTNNIYKIHLELKQMRIDKDHANFAICYWSDLQEAIWTGSTIVKYQPLVTILENDEIYPPTVFIRALEFAWRSWRNHELDDEQVKDEIIRLCEWVDTISRSQPKTKYWMRVF